MYDLNKLTTLALALGIKLTRATPGEEIFECWADRVMEAEMLTRRGKMDRAAEVIEDASNYAI